MLVIGGLVVVQRTAAPKDSTPQDEPPTIPMPAAAVSVPARAQPDRLGAEHAAVAAIRMTGRIATAGFISRSDVIGSIASVRERLPLVVSFGGERFRILDLDGDLVAHATVCPHWLGPLEATLVVEGCIRCPWHGYAFEVRTGRSADGRGLEIGRAHV